MDQSVYVLRGRWLGGFIPCFYWWTVRFSSAYMKYIYAMLPANSLVFLLLIILCLSPSLPLSLSAMFSLSFISIHSFLNSLILIQSVSYCFLPSTIPSFIFDSLNYNIMSVLNIIFFPNYFQSHTHFNTQEKNYATILGGNKWFCPRVQHWKVHKAESRDGIIADRDPEWGPRMLDPERVWSVPCMLLFSSFFPPRQKKAEKSDQVVFTSQSCIRFSNNVLPDMHVIYHVILKAIPM